MIHLSEYNICGRSEKDEQHLKGSGVFKVGALIDKPHDKWQIPKLLNGIIGLSICCRCI